MERWRDGEMEREREIYIYRERERERERERRRETLNVAEKSFHASGTFKY